MEVRFFVRGVAHDLQKNVFGLDQLFLLGRGAKIP